MAQGIKILYEGGVGELEEKKSRFIATTLPISSQEEALEFIEKHPSVKQKKFRVDKLINKKPSETQNGTRKYFLKPVGTSQKPFKDEYYDTELINQLKKRVKEFNNRIRPYGLNIFKDAILVITRIIVLNCYNSYLQIHRGTVLYNDIISP